MGFSSTVERVGRDSSRWLGRHQSLGRPLGFLRRHWLVALAVISLAGLIVVVNPGRIFRLFLEANRRDLLLMAPCVVFIYVFRGIGWWVTLRRIGLRITIFRAVYVMFLGRTLIFVPTGDLMRIALLTEKEQHGVNAGEVAGTIAFQELVYTGLIGLGVLPRIYEHPQFIALVVAMLAAHVGIFGILLWKRLYEWAVRVVERVRVFRRFDEPLRSLRPAFLRMTKPGVVVLVVFWDALAVFFLMSLFYLAVVAVDGPRVTLGQTTFAYGLGHILGGLSLLPSGMGAMEAIVAGLLVTQGVHFYAGVAGVILFRAYNDLFSALLGGLVGLVGGRFRGPLRRVQPFSKG